VRQIWVGCILLSTAVGGHAATLGRHSGAAVIGRPLDVRVQALLGPDEDLSSLCVQSDVFYGDTQVSPGAVRTVAQKAAPDAEASLRIQASVPVDEPVVTVYVRAGCNAPFSRRYVLLADPVTEPQSAALSAAPAASAVASAGLPARALPSANAIAGPSTGGAAVVAPSAAAAATGGGAAGAAPVAPAKTAAAPSVRTKPADSKPSKPASVVRKPAAPAMPRLELDPVDVNLALDRDPVLKMSLSMLSEPTASDEERAAAARLWKAINASPEDILRDNQKLEVLEAEAKGLREQETRNKATIEAMESQLEQSRYMTWLVYALGASLLAAVLALLYVWRKRGSAKGDGDSAARAWWAAAEAEKEMETGVPMPNGKAGAQALDLDLDLDLGQGRSSSLDSLRSLHDSDLDADSAPAMLATDKRDFAASQIGVSRSVATEELFDVQQQADFFISLGENEQAIQVLKNHLADSQEPSALAYLDLFKLYHKLGRRDEYNRLRDDFNRLFNAGAPPFDQYSDDSRGLETYEGAFSRIQALWPQPKVLDVIERSIFREQGDPDAEVFDLEAYRELLLLHAIAKDMIKRESAESRPSEDFQHTAIKPLKAAGNKVLAAAVAASAVTGRETQPMDVIPHASPRLGLDVDLDELSEISAFEASLPEVPSPVQPTAKPAPPPGASPDLDMGNLIDFEMLDFMPPDDDEGSNKKRSPS
jgi:hypothetical protein